MPAKNKVSQVTDALILNDLMAVITEHRTKVENKAAYELYAVNTRNNVLEVRRLDHAPTSGDFAPKILKGRIAAFLGENQYVVQYRNAWSTSSDIKVVAHEAPNA